MKQVDLVLLPHWIITVDSDNQVLENHAVVINNGIIEDICSVAVAKEKYDPKSSKHLAEHALLPGFVNAHTHISMNLLRGLADDLKLMDWLQNHIWPAEQKWMGQEFVRVGSSLAIAEMLKSGITCFNDMYFFPEVTAEVVKEVGIRSCIGLTVMDLPTAWAQTAEEYLEKGLDVYNQYKNEELVNFTFAPHSVYTVSDPVLARVGELAKELNIPINIHAHETADEIQQSVDKAGKRPLRRLAELGFPLENTLLVHMTQVTDDDYQVLAETAANVVHCPESNMKLASGYCPVTDFIKAGVNVALGTDGVASNNDLDMFGEMRSASYLAKLMNRNPQALPATETLKLATCNGAKAVGMADKIGSLEIGKAADCIAVNLSKTNTMPVYHPVSQIVYSAGPQNVSDVWVAGKQLLDNQRLTTINEDDLLSQVSEWQQKIVGSDKK